MRRRAGVAASVVMVALAVGACSEQPSMTAADARLFAEEAWESIGLEGAEVAESVTPTRCGQPPADGWETFSSVPSGGTATLCVARHDDRALFLKDVGPGEVGPLLTEQQFRRLEAFRYNPAAQRRAEEVRMPTLVASVLSGIVCLAHLGYGFRRRRHRAR